MDWWYKQLCYKKDFENEKVYGEFLVHVLYLTTSDYLQVNFNSDDDFKEVNYKDSNIYKMYKMYLDNSDRMQDRLFNS